MKYLRLNRRLLPLNALLVAGSLIWAACGEEVLPPKAPYIPPTPHTTPYTPPTVELEPYIPPITTTTEPFCSASDPDCEYWPHDWTDERVAEFYNGFAEGYGREMDALGNCVAYGLIDRYSYREIVAMEGYSEAQFREIVRPIVKKCS